MGRAHARVLGPRLEALCILELENGGNVVAKSHLQYDNEALVSGAEQPGD